VRSAITALGDDIAVSPRKTVRELRTARASSRSCRRRHARAWTSASVWTTRPRTGRLAAAGSFGSGNITHRVGLSAPEEVDDEVRRLAARRVRRRRLIARRVTARRAPAA
jgi:hypothetical protein